MPPVECLSTFGASNFERSNDAPEFVIARVQWTSSPDSIPRCQIDASNRAERRLVDLFPPDARHEPSALRGTERLAIALGPQDLA